MLSGNPVPPLIRYRYKAAANLIKGVYIMTIHQNIRDLRKARSLTQEQLADVMGVSTASVPKWENGQCAPELTVLADLADYFQVSIDALMGHEVNPERMDSMLTNAEQLADTDNHKEAAALAETILRNYPNSPEAVDRCASIFYKLYIHVGHKPYMERCIALTKRLDVLTPDSTESEKQERVISLANQYELIEDWDTAKGYYEQTNILHLNDRHIARCLKYQGKTEEALSTISDVVQNNLMQQMHDANTLAEIWEEKGDLSKAIQALQWAVTGMELTGYNPQMRMLLYVKISLHYETAGDLSQAKDYIRKAAQMAKQIGSSQPAPFLQPGKDQQILSNMQGTGEEMLKSLLKNVNPVLRRAAMAEFE